ncbi:MAG: anthranilate synthase component I family protein [Planctomycetes bacterium]|nr:anthranilate synthase component I family protein [Planctomycetota bacterium]
MPRILVRVLQRVADADPTRMLAALPPNCRPVLLDSSSGRGASLLAWNPDRTVAGRLRPDSCMPCGGGPRSRWPLASVDPALLLEQASQHEDWQWEHTDLPQMGGWIGYLSFECGHAWEPFPWLPADPAGFDDYHFARYRNAVLFLPTGEALLLWGEDESLSPQIANAERADLADQFNQLLGAPPIATSAAWLPAPPQPVGDAQSYQESVRQMRRWIGAGELFQANLSHRMQGPAPQDARAFYASLRPRQPTEMSAYFETGAGRALLSWSPETFLSVRGTQLRTKPIKGTAMRGDSPELDAALAAELDASIKERAELNMIVDMARNDLGRVAEPGLVRLIHSGKVVPFPTLFHRVAEVQAKWNPSLGLRALMQATFPPASVTGAPKVRALQAIAELEQSARGPYCGTFGYWLPGEPRAEFSVLIRTSTVGRKQLSLRVGAGIVWDSDPLLEWQETLVKARYLTQQPVAAPLRVNA